MNELEDNVRIIFKYDKYTITIKTDSLDLADKGLKKLEVTVRDNNTFVNYNEYLVENKEDN